MTKDELDASPFSIKSQAFGFFASLLRYTLGCKDPVVQRRGGLFSFAKKTYGTHAEM